ncbi:MAG: Maf family nucleotide pyrophosphatase [Sutterellaceae bacterium]|nr:Maf family nucleotide pyrophosphatase [Sutterellaceae bacterium]MDD7441278.1 Maf family nucleotide pyrophosphatase [Sutterellaceae bacterium]MDY2868849.1 Maf family nucleotide pyrophosphatase [Mesosutterella sp.]
MAKNPELILASSSRYRRELLDRLGLPYTAEASDIDETSPEGETPVAACKRLAVEKAKFIAARHPGAVVIGSDQVADLGGKRLGKPHTRDRAIAQLLEMQGRTTVFYTALAVIDAKGTVRSALSATRVKMRPLSRETIEAYVDREEPFDCAGSAKIEKLGVALMERVDSDDPTSLVGLPLITLTTLLSQSGIEVLPGLCR